MSQSSEEKYFYYVGKWNWFKYQGRLIFHDHDFDEYGTVQEGKCNRCDKKIPGHMIKLAEFTFLTRKI